MIDIILIGGPLNMRRHTVTNDTTIYHGQVASTKHDHIVQTPAEYKRTEFTQYDRIVFEWVRP